jgi:hypothetical protein
MINFGSWGNNLKLQSTYLRSFLLHTDENFLARNLAVANCASNLLLVLVITSRVDVSVKNDVSVRPEKRAFELPVAELQSYFAALVAFSGPVLVNTKSKNRHIMI